MNFNFKKDIVLNETNFSLTNPINKNDVKRKKINGKYITEKFYLIDFFDIRDNSYIISSFGRVFSLITNQEIKGHKNPKRNNYNTIMLRCNNTRERNFPIHTLVARAFIPKTASDKRLNRVYVHHKNWDNDYNYYWNLEWRSSSEINMIYKIQNNKDIEEEEIVKVVCRLLERETPIVEIFDIIDRKLSKDKISRIKNKKIYQDISYKYKI
jgi:hypothetical protein